MWVLGVGQSPLSFSGSLSSRRPVLLFTAEEIRRQNFLSRFRKVLQECRSDATWKRWLRRCVASTRRTLWFQQRWEKTRGCGQCFHVTLCRYLSPLPSMFCLSCWCHLREKPMGNSVEQRWTKAWWKKKKQISPYFFENSLKSARWHIQSEWKSNHNEWSSSSLSLPLCERTLGFYYWDQTFS